MTRMFRRPAYGKPSDAPTFPIFGPEPRPPAPKPTPTPEQPQPRSHPSRPQMVRMLVLVEQDLLLAGSNWQTPLPPDVRLRMLRRSRAIGELLKSYSDDTAAFLPGMDTAGRWRRSYVILHGRCETAPS